MGDFVMKVHKSPFTERIRHYLQKWDHAIQLWSTHFMRQIEKSYCDSNSEHKNRNN